MRKLSEAFRLPVLEDLQDYKKSTNLLIAILYFIPTIFIMYFFGLKTQIIVTPIVLFLMIFLYRKVLIRDLMKIKNNLIPYISFIFVGFVIQFILSSIIGGSITSTLVLAITEMETPLSALNPSANQAAATSVAIEFPLISFISMVIASPITEELMFRRIFKLTFKSRFMYYLFASVTFGLAHIIVGFIYPFSFVFIFPYLFFGFVCAYMYSKTNNIWTSIFLHMISNGLAYTIMLLS